MKKAEFFLLGAHKLLRETTRDTDNWIPGRLWEGPLIGTQTNNVPWNPGKAMVHSYQGEMGSL